MIMMMMMMILQYLESTAAHDHDVPKSSCARGDTADRVP